MNDESSTGDAAEQAVTDTNPVEQAIKSATGTAAKDMHAATYAQDRAATDNDTRNAAEIPPQTSHTAPLGALPQSVDHDPVDAAEEVDILRPSLRGNHTAELAGRSSKPTNLPTVGHANTGKMADVTPAPATGPTGRGRPIGRPRGSRARGTTRGSTRGGRGGKRKRAEAEDDDESSGSEIYIPTASTTKSGRSVQKPTSFVPPPQPSPTTVPAYKKKRNFRRNPESAVCKICLRGVSPASNMIVFCDGCNTPYHRYCHQPPIDQSVIDEVNKEWYCKQCERQRIQPVPETELVGFITAQGASAEERQKYFSSLPPGLLVTLLTRATTLQPDLPLFDPTFQPKSHPVPSPLPKPATNGHAHPPVRALPVTATSNPQTPVPSSFAAATVIRDAEESDDGYGPDEHPSHYPRPGQGLMATLPPESEDVHFLVDDENARGVFTHVYQVDTQAANAHFSVGAER